MSDYDFTNLNDKDFEVLCCDLIGVVEKRRIERFKPGKDKGVDGRFFSDKTQEVILQCKHWVGTPFSTFVNALIKKELPKIKKLNPARYIIAVSYPLSRTNKKSIFDALSPYVKSEDDIYGKELLNDILRQNFTILQAHYKLWLQSSDVLKIFLNGGISARSKFSVDEFMENAKRYVPTENHAYAIEQLENQHVIIITGEPGLGKTTLAEQICLHYVVNKYEFVELAEFVGDGEAYLTDKDKLQIFYFDDFLGGNYLEAIRGNKGAHIAQFMRRIRENKNKRFVLTSRSTILNQGKLLIDALTKSNVKKNEYELRIESLVEMDKARILYNHIWHSSLPVNFREELYVNKRYRSVIAHKNFNPRLISFITDITRQEDTSSEGYWPYVMQSLNNPKMVWDHPFVAQLDDFGRAVVILVTFSGGRAVSHADLVAGYHRYTQLPHNINFSGRREFIDTVRVLTGAFLNRIVVDSKEILFSLFNPSIADYVLHRYEGDIDTILHAVSSMRTVEAVNVVESLEQQELITKSDAKKIVEKLLRDLVSEEFYATRAAYVSIVCNFLVKENPTAINISSLQRMNFEQASNYLLKNHGGIVNSESMDFIAWCFKQDLICDDDLVIFLKAATNCIPNAWRRLTKSILKTTELLPITFTDEKASILVGVGASLVDIASEDIEHMLDFSDVFSNIDFEDYDEASDKLFEALADVFADLGIQVEDEDLSRMLDEVNVPGQLDRYFGVQDESNSIDYREFRIDSSQSVDDLFDRG